VLTYPYTHLDTPLPCIPQHVLQAAALIEAHGLDDTTYIYDLGNTTRLFKAWCGALPRVKPFYAVKCNPEVGSSATTSLMCHKGFMARQFTACRVTAQPNAA
jgi:hypothetical protein